MLTVSNYRCSINTSVFWCRIETLDAFVATFPWTPTSQTWKKSRNIFDTIWRNIWLHSSRCQMVFRSLYCCQPINHRAESRKVSLWDHLIYGVNKWTRRSWCHRHALFFIVTHSLIFGHPEDGGHSKAGVDPKMWSRDGQRGQEGRVAPAVLPGVERRHLPLDDVVPHQVVVLFDPLPSPGLVPEHDSVHLAAYPDLGDLREGREWWTIGEWYSPSGGGSSAAWPRTCSAPRWSSARPACCRRCPGRWGRSTASLCLSGPRSRCFGGWRRTPSPRWCRCRRRGRILRPPSRSLNN